MKLSVTSAAIIWGSLAMMPIGVEGQTIRDITEHEPTKEEFIEVLKPRMRGIALSGETAGSCSAYHPTRGIEPLAAAPVADIAAIHVTFAFNSAQLRPETLPTLQRLGEALKSGELEQSCIQIEGHTDSIGSDNYNLKLSQRRAESVVQYLVQRMGIRAERLAAVGKGKQEPIASNVTDAGRQKNRRVQIVNLGYAKAAAHSPR